MGRSLVGVRGGVERVYPSVTVCVNVREDFPVAPIPQRPNAATNPGMARSIVSGCVLSPNPAEPYLPIRSLLATT